MLEYIETCVPVSTRCCFYGPSNTILWESDDPVTIVLDEFFIEDEDLPEDGLFFFDSELQPVVLDLYFFSFSNINNFITTLCIWPIFDITKKFDNVFILETSINLHLMRNNQLRKRWNSTFHFFRNINFTVFSNPNANYCIGFRLVGLSFVCNMFNSQTLRLIVSNTHDILLTPPETLSICIGQPNTNNESTRFFFFSKNYHLLQQYAKKIHSLVPFNVYEYKGLIFDGETKRKKITKQKQK
jgi:hypothetical protein